MAKPKKHNGLYRKTFRLEPNGTRYYVYGKTLEELTENEVQKREELKQGLEEIYNPTLSQYYNHFSKEREFEVKESTIRAQVTQFNTVSMVEMMDGVKMGDMRIKDITRRHVTDARIKLLESGKTPQNLNIIFKHLNHVFNSAVRDDAIIKNPMAGLKPLKIESEEITENRHRALTVEETVDFFKAARERKSFYTNAFLFMINSGVRVGELAALNKKDIDEKRGYIYIRRTLTRDVIGGYVIGKDAKTKSGRRDIPLTEELRNIINDQIYQNEQMFDFNRDDNLLFKSSEGEYLREYTINREIKRICKAADVEYFTCHAFRNTFATRYIEQRPQDYKILSEILGHKDVSITLNLYTHVMSEHKENSMKSIRIDTF